MKQCTKCLNPETAESISFDTGGVCSVCQHIEYKTTEVDWEARDREFDELLEQYRGRSDYDCIVPFSGGKDSTFALWYLVVKKQLKPLVVRFDHSFFRSKVNENTARTIRSLGVDMVQFTPNWQVVRKLMFESLKRRGDFCWHCHTGIHTYPMWEAIRRDVPLVLYGEKAEYDSFYENFDDEWENDERRFNLKINLGINAEDMLGMLDDTVSGYAVTERDLRPYSFPPRKLLREKKVNGQFLGNYMPWDLPKQVAIVKSELGWEGDEVEGVPPRYDYEKIECVMQGVRDYLKYLKRGVGRTNHLASIDIRYGRLSREEGKSLEDEYDGRRPAALDIFLKAVDMSEDEFLDLARNHVVAPRELPSNEELKQNRTNRIPWDFDQWSKIVETDS